MRSDGLPISALPAWIKLNNVVLNEVTISTTHDNKGLGIISCGGNLDDCTPLITVPQSLVLSLENVWVFAKADHHLREVLEAAGEYSRTARGAILIFLLLQLTHYATSLSEQVGASNPFAQYIKFLPSEPLPTFWSNTERALLAGTSLEAALDAKIKSLDREFTEFEKATSSINWCQKHWWSVETGQLSFDDWKRIDAMYRSRALDLPGTGHAMVPCIDMANHASASNTSAAYDTDHNGNAVLVLRDGKSIQAGEEVTITYGDEKGACEMLFSYGFIEDVVDSAHELYLDLEIPEDDPLKFAKKSVSRSVPGFRIFIQGVSIGWEGSFVWLLCVNEEDGLQFRLLQTNNDERELQVFWDDVEIKDVSRLHLLLKALPLWDVFSLRAVTILQARVEVQLLSLERSKAQLKYSESHVQIDSNIRHKAMRLRDLEETLLLQAYQEFEEQKLALLKSKTVLEYLGPATADDTAAFEHN